MTTTVYTARHGHADVVLAPTTHRRAGVEQEDYYVRERRRDGSWVTYDHKPYFFVENAQAIANAIDLWAWSAYRRENSA